MITVTITVDYKTLAQIEHNILDAQRQFKTLLSKRVNAHAARALHDIRNAPSSPKYPIEWQSERQRKAFFASKGFGRGIPYRRTGKLQASWAIEKNFDLNSGKMDLVNNAPEAVYVQGDIVQRMHLASGWPQVDDVANKYDVLLADTIVKTWDEIAGSI